MRDCFFSVQLVPERKLGGTVKKALGASFA